MGVGTRYGSGCTSGHGVCGLSRLSPRSLAATLAFMVAGFATVFVVRHLVRLSMPCTALSAFAAGLDLRHRTDRFRHGRSVQGDRLPGSCRAVGSLACLRDGRRDSGVGRGVSLRAASAPGPCSAARCVCPRHGTSTGAWSLGSLVFGVGWGLAGFCPAPAVVVVRRRASSRPSCSCSRCSRAWRSTSWRNAGAAGSSLSRPQRSPSSWNHGARDDAYAASSSMSSTVSFSTDAFIRALPAPARMPCLKS